MIVLAIVCMILSIGFVTFSHWCNELFVKKQYYLTIKRTCDFAFWMFTIAAIILIILSFKN